MKPGSPFWVQEITERYYTGDWITLDFDELLEALVREVVARPIHWALVLASTTGQEFDVDAYQDQIIRETAAIGAQLAALKRESSCLAP